ncbi:MAG: hypothetical protein M1819_001266 [Sarea resinae]|nr:MAG: hypothetical protein M1819_001266 [Sarea resinae]
MVEDELLSVAKQFTQHLHHAEYLRLKNLAKAQNASTIQSIARPVDTKTKMSDDLQRQKAAAATHKGQKDVLRDLKSGSAKIQSRGPGSDSEDDREDDPWVGTTLHGLMTSPRRSKKSLRGLAEVKSSTRAAAGFTKSRTNPRDEPAPSTFTAQKPTRDARPADPVEDATTSGDDDDDLDASSSKPTKGSSTHPTSPSDRLGPRPRIDSRQPPFDQPGQKTLSHKSPSRYDHPADARVSSARPDSKLPHIRRNPVAENKGDLNLDDQDLLPLPQASLLSEDAVQRLARRKALQAKKTRIKEEQERKAISVDDIPTFAV